MPTSADPLLAELDSVHRDRSAARPAVDDRRVAGESVVGPADASRVRSTPSDRDRMGELPYGPFLTGSLPALSRAFRVLNRVYVLPAIKAGLGPLHANPLTGAFMLLRTTGRRSGLQREVALGYAFVDGSVVCSAGFGPATAWYRNLLAEPRVEIVLGSSGFAGRAEPVTDAAELDRAWRALIRSLGILGRLFVGRPDMSPAELAAATANIPLVRIRITGLAPGPADPGGRLWIVTTAVGLAWLGTRLRRRRRR